jgi:hypothetical protein
MRIGVDLDGVGYDYAAAFTKYVRDEGIVTKCHCPESGLIYNLYESMGISRDEFADISNQAASKGVLFNGPAILGFPEALRWLKEKGHDIHIVTARSYGPDPEGQTLAWLAKEGIPFDTITFDPDKTVVPTDVFIEDVIKNYDALDQTDCLPFLVDRHYNQVPGGDSRRRVDGTRHFAQIVWELNVFDLASNVA